jgi:hypothetical protein
MAPRSSKPDKGGSWHPGDAQLGWIIENRLDETYLLSWPSPLEIYVPLHDTGGYDRARAPMGSYDFRLDQIKGTASLHSGNQMKISFRTPALHPRKNVDFTMVYFDLRSGSIADPVYKFSSTKLDEVCTRAGDDWTFVANRSGLARDRAAKYQLSVRELAASHGWSTVPPKSPGERTLRSVAAAGEGVSSHPVEVSAFFKRHFDAQFLETATGDEMLMAAQPDVFGRHRVAFLKSTGHWASLSIHGGTFTGSTQLIQANIHAASFFAHPQHYILVQHYFRERREWYPWSWLIRSTEFARLARGKGPYLIFTTTLNPQRVNRWLPYRIPTEDVAKIFRGALTESATRRAA